MMNDNSNIDPKKEDWVSLGLNGIDDDEEEEEEEFSSSNEFYGRFVVEYNEKEWLCYGGDSGTVTCVNWETKEHREVLRMDEPITALAYYHTSMNNPQLAVGCEDGSVHIYHDQVEEMLQSTKNDEDDFFSQSMTSTSDAWVLSRRDCPIRDMCLWQKNRLVVATESGLAWIDLTKSAAVDWKEEEKVNQVQQQGGIRALSCYQQHLLLVCGMDGKCSMWDADWQCVFRWDDEPKMSVDVGLGANTVMDVAAKPNHRDSLLFLPYNKLQLFDGQQWQTMPTEDNKDVSYVCGAILPDNHLAVASASGTVQLYHHHLPELRGKFQTTIATISKPTKITQLLWSDKNATLNIVCNNGSVQRITNLQLTNTNNKELPKEINHSVTSLPVETEPILEEEDSKKEQPKEEESQQETYNTKQSPLSYKRLRKGITKDENKQADMDEDDFMFQDETDPKTKVIDDDDQEGDNEKEESKESIFVDNAAQEGDEKEAEEEDHFEDFGVSNKLSKNDDHNDDDIMEEEDDVMTPPEYLPTPQEYVSTVEMQPAFAPASTPDILCWNQEGTVTSLPNEVDGNNKVYITFTDSAFRKPVSFHDTLGFIGGSLGQDGAIFFSDVEMTDNNDDDLDVLQQVNQLSDATKAVVRESTRKKQTKGSSIYFLRFDTSGSEKQWLWVLPHSEKAIGCASGKGWAAIITNKKLLRLYSSSGVHKHILWIKGQQYVTCAGRGRLLAIVHHTSNPTMDGSQCLGFTIYDAVQAKVLYTGELSAISPGSTLTWVGFGHDLSFCALDSKGMFSMFQQDIGWIPFLDTSSHKKSSTDVFWPVTVIEGKLMSVYLRGGAQYPDATRRPITTSLKLTLPLAIDSDGRSDKIDDASLRATIALHQRKFTDKLKMKDGTDNAEDVMEEYDNLCATVDKVTLKLFINTCKTGKVEKALDITKRLFLEKSFDVAMTIADRLNLRKLSDRIMDYKEIKFTLDEEEDDFSSDGQDYTYQYTREDSREDRNQVSPDTAAHKRRLLGDYNNKNSKRKLDTATEKESFTPSISQVSSNQRVKTFNPFGKKKIQSPGKLMSPMNEEKNNSNAKLSRQSTFTNHSRQLRLSEKQIL